MPDNHIIKKLLCLFFISFFSKIPLQDKRIPSLFPPIAIQQSIYIWFKISNKHLTHSAIFFWDFHVPCLHGESSNLETKVYKWGTTVMWKAHKVYVVWRICNRKIENAENVKPKTTKIVWTKSMFLCNQIPSI